jgi:hypothetical protein
MRSSRQLFNLLLAAAMVAALLVPAIVAAAEPTVVRVPLKSPAQMEEIAARGIEVLAFTKYGVDLLVDEEQMAFMRSRPYPASVISFAAAERAVAALDENLGEYHTYAETESVLTYLAATYPAIASTSVIGTSLEGRNISMLKISDNVGSDESEPEVLYMGNHHARELMSVDIPLRFAQYLLERYGIDPTVTGYIDNREVFFIPMVNPDGHVYVELNHAGSPNGWWRKNRRVNYDASIGVDLNRNYGFEWGYDNVGSSPTPSSPTYRGAGAFSEPETQVIRNFINGRAFVAWFSYHSYGELLLLPWGYISADTPDHDVYATLGDSLVAENGYFAGNPKAGAIYLVNGGSDDWGYGEQISKGKIFAFTPEVNSAAQGGFGPSDTLIAPTFALLLPMNLRLLEYADNPWRVLGPEAPVQYAVTNPWGNDVHLLSWSEGAPLDPNPPVDYTIEACETPSLISDPCETLNGPWAYGPDVSLVPGYVGNAYDMGDDDYLNSTITASVPLVVDAASDTLLFWIEYHIEVDYDYGYVEVDDGSGWTTVQGNITTTDNPYGNNHGHGITGSTGGGWVMAVFPLTAYLGQEVALRMSYVTDAFYRYPGNPGMRVDVITPVPTCASVTTLAQGVTGNSYEVVPTSTGTWRYRVRATDADGQNSDWSNSRDYAVTTLTGAGETGRFATALGRNFPNPFNPTTTIPYVVGGERAGAPVRVALAVHDVRGARVATLVQRTLAPGVYEARWDGRDDAGRSLASGVYFARLAVEGQTAQTRKIVLLK